MTGTPCCVSKDWDTVHSVPRRGDKERMNTREERQERMNTSDERQEWMHRRKERQREDLSR